MDTVRIGVVGLGGMGVRHARSLLAGEVTGAALTAICDVRRERLAWAREHLSSEPACFDDLDALLNAGVADAVIVATRHYQHPPLAIRCFAAGMHVLTEKPAGVYAKQVGEMNRAAAASGKVFAINYQMRTDPLYRRLKEMVEGGELGEIKRTNWVITAWYRPQSYYDRDDWRATWAGEGGGVLINQAPHQLDLWQWCCGMPARLRAFCYYGKHHDIEAEDDVTAFVEYPNGATGVFVTSTGDAPGSNRLEVTGDNGKVVVEDGRLTFWKLDVPEPRFRREHRTGPDQPGYTRVDVPVAGRTTGHAGITRNFVEAITGGACLLAPGQEGIRGLSISNAMHLSAWLDDWVTVPPDEDLFYEKLRERGAGSGAGA